MCRIHFYEIFADSRLFVYASLDLHLSFSSVREWGGWGSADGLTNTTYIFYFFSLLPMIYIFHIYLFIFFATLEFWFMPAKTYIHRSTLSTIILLYFFLKCCRLFYESLIATSYYIINHINPYILRFFKKNSQRTPKIIKNKRRKS